MLTVTHYSFGPFELYPSEHLLVRDGQAVPLAPKAFDLLLALVSNHGRLLTRETLMKTIWPDSFVEETNLTVNISLLRKALGEMDDGRPWIATAPKRGYRFDGAVTLTDEKPLSAAPGTPADAPPETTARIAGALDLSATPGPQPSAVSPPLPPTPTATPAQRPRFLGWLAASLVLMGGLVAVSLLTRRMNHGHESPAEVSRVGTPATEQHSVAKPNTPNSAAYELYTQGRFYSTGRSVEAMQKSIDFFQRAIQAEPGYAAAYAGLADAYVLAGSYGSSFLAPNVALPKAKIAIEKALALDDSSAEAHASRGYIRLLGDFDWTGAEQEFKRALELNPNCVKAHHWYSHELTALGRVAESHRESEIALALDPTDEVINEHMAWHHMMSREYDRAITQAKKAIELDPAFVLSHRVLGLSYLYTGRHKEACAEFEQGVELSHDDPVARGYLARCYATANREAEARKILASLEGESVERYISALEIAPLYVALGDHESALRWIDKALDEHVGALVYLNVDRAFDPLRSDPRFQVALKRVHLLPEADEAVPH
jgi:DNA-binding winged helix-turn-helix (wHTH) protein/tetratricopeptide (TPR) repeat protein